MVKKPKAIKTPPSEEELANRLKNVRNIMNKEDLDYFVCFDPVNIYYLTNFAFYVHERPFLLIIGRKGPMKFLIPLLEEAHVKDRAIGDLVTMIYYEFPSPPGLNWYEKYEELIENHSNVGVEPAMTMEIYQKTPGNKNVSDILDEVRIIKSDYEIGRIVHACKIVSKGHKKLLKMCKPGMAEFAIFQEATSTMTSKIIQDIPSANFKATETTAAVWPPNISHEPHLVPDIFAKMQEGGPHVSIVQAQVDGYGVEIERTFFLGYIPEKAKKPFEIMFNARKIAYDMLKPGVIMSEIDRKVREYISENGYGDYIIHRTGHGFGITGHEAPYVAEGYDRKLETNMVISIEPGIYIPGIGGFRHSDTVLITEESFLKLTKAPETLEDVIIKID
jgi:Xaa-Pro dipeptidase